MKGGINKLVRNIVATKGKSDFEKVSDIVINNFPFLETYQSYLSYGLKRT
jgi:hypothetical protein